MFMGEYLHTIDEKGRLIMPAKFREELGTSFVVTKGLDGCLFVYSQLEWTALEKKLRSLPFTRADARAFSRFFFSGATECQLDKQGRVLLPGNLRNYSGLNKDVLVIGVSNRVEIWSQENWNEYNEQTQGSYEELAEKLMDFNLEL